jgi:hypothetical protein
LERLINILLLVFLSILTFTDYKYFLVPNIVIFPSIILGCSLTLNFLPILVTFFSLMIINEIKILKYGYAGGDIKLFTMIAAFKGWLVIPIVILTYFIIKTYREYENYRYTLPVTPFASLATVFIILSAVALRWIVH